MVSLFLFSAGHGYSSGVHPRCRVVRLRNGKKTTKPAYNCIHILSMGHRRHHYAYCDQSFISSAVVSGKVETVSEATQLPLV